MADRHAIDQLFADFGWWNDERRWDRLDEVFTSDGEFSITIAGGDLIGPFVSVEAIVEFCTAAGADLQDQRRHVVSNIRIVEEAPESARATGYLTLLATQADSLEVKSAGVMTTEAVATSEGWRFKSIRLALDKAF
jgi:hypothetical protein